MSSIRFEIVLAKRGYTGDYGPGCVDFFYGGRCVRISAFTLSGSYPPESFVHLFRGSNSQERADVPAAIQSARSALRGDE